ncbi:MAG: HPF/RaiA family ribosome-associated protein [Gammaproteobacteria bacterium]|nr:HPF/RaiA family ribosome-associated protein [Gammaproteobacteria bacterium]
MASVPLEISFRNLKPSAAVEARIRERTDKLDKFCDQIMRCRVMVEAPHRHHHKGNLYHIRIDVTVPGEEIVVKRSPGGHHAHEDVYVAVRDAFNAVARQLEDYMRRRRGDVKTREPVLHGRIAELWPEKNFGRLATPDGRLVYFHRHSLINAAFGNLKIGAEVRFNEEQGEAGPQATSISVVGKHHVVG